MRGHQHEIAPLLKNRGALRGEHEFCAVRLLDRLRHGGRERLCVLESLHDQRARSFYNNRYGSTHGTIHISAASMDKGRASCGRRSLAEGLAIALDDRGHPAYRDTARGLEYLRRATDIHHHGLTVDLRGYQYVVLLDWRELRSTAEQPWDRLCDALHGERCA